MPSPETQLALLGVCVVLLAAIAAGVYAIAHEVRAASRTRQDRAQAPASVTMGQTPRTEDQ